VLENGVDDGSNVDSSGRTGAVVLKDEMIWKKEID